MSRRAPATSPPPGLAARRIAADILDGVLRRGRPLDEQLDGTAHPGLARCPTATAPWCGALVATVLRRLGTLRHLLGHLSRARRCRPMRRGSKRCCCSAPRKSCCSTCRITPRSISSVRLVQADRRAARYAGLVNAVLRRVAREGARNSWRGIDSALLDTPEWLMRALDRAYGAETARAIARRATAQEPALDLTREGRSRRLGERARRPRAADRLGARGRCTGRFRSCRALTTAPGGCRTPPRRCRRGCSAIARQDGGRSLRGARRQDRAARRMPARRSPRSTARAARLARLRQNLDAAGADGRDRRGRRRAMERRPVRRRAARRALLLDRHHPPPSRHPLAQDARPTRQARRLAAPAARPCRGAAQARRHAGLLHLLAGARGGRAGDRRTAGAPARPAPQSDPAGRGRAAWPSCSTASGDLRTLPCHLPDADPRMAGLDGFYAARIVGT